MEHKMKDNIIEICNDIGIDQVGIAPAGPYHELKSILTKRYAEGKFTGFEEADIDKRLDAHMTMEQAQSVIVCLFPYFRGFEKDSNISIHAYSVDYHKIGLQKLKALGDQLKKTFSDFEYMEFVDNGPLVDRYMAYLAGLGYYGINNCIINDKYGSFVFIGYLINNYPLKSDKPDKRTCMRCGACIKACPGSAIPGEFDFNPLRCLSYVTQKKEDLSPTQIAILAKHNKVYGCDVCQMVCPHNRGIRQTDIKEFTENLITNLDPEEIQSLSNNEFKRKYKDRTFAWRGRKILNRNFDVIKQD